MSTVNETQALPPLRRLDWVTILVTAAVAGVIAGVFAFVSTWAAYGREMGELRERSKDTIRLLGESERELNDRIEELEISHQNLKSQIAQGAGTSALSATSNARPPDGKLSADLKELGGEVEKLVGVLTEVVKIQARLQMRSAGGDQGVLYSGGAAGSYPNEPMTGGRNPL